MITELITNVAIMAAVVVIGSEYLSKLTKAGGFWAQFQSWALGVILAWIASYVGIGIFTNVTLFSVLLYGLLIGLVANGIFDIPFSKTVLEWIKARIVKPVA